MKTAGLFVNPDKDPELHITRELIKAVESAGMNYVVFPILDKSLRNKIANNVSELPEEAWVVISVGGDGTYLKAARTVYRKDIPVLGINLGSLGFLTDIDKNEIAEAAECLANGNYKIENRMMLDVEIIRDGKIITEDTALNDIVISRGALSRILHLKAHVNDVFVDLFPGDGLIVSTPTGSTAYSLSAGGPIVEPDAELIILTPVCPHLLYTRSLITHPQKLVKVLVEEEKHHKAMVTVDGQQGYELSGGDTVVVRKSEYNTKMIKIKNSNFFNILRSKIYYRGEMMI